MLIEEPEVLKGWLTTHLEPLCDADPAALAKYVLALLKKEKPKEELKDSMVQQMDVFLQTETNSFIDMLFKIVETKEYLNPAKEESEGKPSIIVKKVIVEEESEDLKIEADSTTPIREDKITLSVEEKRRHRSPVRDRSDRRLASRLGPRDMRDIHRRFRSRSRSPPLSPRYERARGRRRSRSPLYMERRRRSLEYILRRGRSRDSTPTRDEGVAGYTPTPKKPRCRDYNEKGFCLRGDICRYDHGSDAVVLEDAAKALHAPAYQPTDPYVPGVPQTGIPYPPPPISYGKRSHDGFGREPPLKLGRGRGRGGRGGRGGGVGKCSMLAVRNIPATLNTITHLNGHFSRYGSLVNVQVQFEGDPSSALITFSNNEDATLAFNSSEAVMNNRFIKMFWHSDKGNVKDRLGNNSAGLSQGKFTRTISNDEKAVELDPEKAKELKAQEKLAIQKNQEMLQTKNELLKKAEEKRKVAMAQQGGILKSKRDLLDGLIEQQKSLITKIENGKATMKQEEKTKVMRLLKELSASIDKTKEDIRNMISIAGLKKRSKTEVQKDLLDAEMELFTKQHEGGPEVDMIQQKVNSLKIEAARIGILPTSRAPRGRGIKLRGGRGRGFAGSPRGGVGAWRGRGGKPRGGATVALSEAASRLDRRPSMILVAGYDKESRDEVLDHFRKFGEVVENLEEEEGSSQSMVLKYKLRRSAETALASVTAGKILGEKTLKLSWYNPAPHTTAGNGDQEDATAGEDGTTPYQEDYLPPGLQEDALNETEATEEINEDLLDEDEEDVEERSWKRRNNEDD